MSRTSSRLIPGIFRRVLECGGLPPLSPTSLLACRLGGYNPQAAAQPASCGFGVRRLAAALAPASLLACRLGGYNRQAAAQPASCGFGVRRLAAAFPRELARVPPRWAESIARSTASKLACSKAAASRRTPKRRAVARGIKEPRHDHPSQLLACEILEATDQPRPRQWQEECFAPSPRR
jgi:hypothetical protein